LSLSCASLASLSVPKLENRTLRLDPDRPGLFYQYCEQHKFLSSECKTWHVDRYDLTDEGVRKDLIARGFVVQSLHRE
jgi:hypothetical protein